MATSSSRLLQLLALLGSRPRWSAADLSSRLEISPRTLRRDMECLRELGYPIGAAKGPDGGYSLGAGGRLPPLLLDDEQVIAVVIALQTAPVTVQGIDEAVTRALTSIKQIMPAHMRAEADAMHLTAIANPWEFAAPPVHADILQRIGAAIRNTHQLRLDYLTPDRRRPQPADPDFTPPLTIEPHHLVVWAARWYLVAYTPSDDDWTIFRVDRVHTAEPLGVPFERRELPEPDVARYVMTSYDRGDTPAQWECVGTAVLDLPPEVVARWAPGGSVIERLSSNQSLVTFGGWSWAGIAGLLATFDADFTIVGPEPLRRACLKIARRLSRTRTASLNAPNSGDKSSWRHRSRRALVLSRAPRSPAGRRRHVVTALALDRRLSGLAFGQRVPTTVRVMLQPAQVTDGRAMSTFWRYVRIQLMVFVFGCVGPIFLVIYFTTQPDPTTKFFYWAGLFITAADVLIALGLTSASDPEKAPVDTRVALAVAKRTRAGGSDHESYSSSD